MKQPSGIFYDQPRFTDSPSSYEFAIGIVEDKPVWEGDRLYYAGKLAITKGENFFTGLAKPYWSWNPPAPPKPKTVMVELLLEDAQRVLYCLDMYEVPVAIMRAKDAVKLAIKETCK